MHKECVSSLGKCASFQGADPDPHISAERLVRYIVLEMAALCNFSSTEKHLIQRTTGPSAEYDW